MSFAAYPQEVMESLKASKMVIKSFGCEVELRRSMELEAEGEVDPRTRATRKKNWVGAGANKKQQTNDVASMVAEMREMMGNANLNLNRAEIYTYYEKLQLGENQVGVWRYFMRRGAKAGRPCVVFFHGGGWYGGTPYVVENACKLIAELADAVVFNIDYSLAPEKPYPNGFNDCYLATKHIYDHSEEYGIDASRIYVAGDSAGGNLAAVVALRARDEGIPMVAGQIMLYPAIGRADVMERFFPWSKNVYTISEKDADLISGMLRLGVPISREKDKTLIAYGADPEDPYVSPILSHSHQDLPPALIMVPEFDGLRQQGEYYAAVLQNAGVSVKTIRYVGCAHAFVDLLGFLPQAEDACREIAAFIQDKK